jgi:clan AA aspartic protease (TIGR02281 family)
MWWVLWDYFADVLLGMAAVCATVANCSLDKEKPQSPPVVQQAPNGGTRVAVNGDSSYQCYVEGKVNGATFSFLIDTGASDVAFGKNDARKLGFDPGSLSFDHSYSSANGVGHQADVTLPELSIGGVVVARNVEASIVNATMSHPLLGASVLKAMHLHYSQGNCELVLPGNGTVATKRVLINPRPASAKY